LHEENKKIKSETFESISEYFPESSLLHKVVLKKKKCSYDLYSSFFEDAKNLTEQMQKKAITFLFILTFRNTINYLPNSLRTIYGGVIPLGKEIL
jgi:hypothetical protein